MISTPKSLLHLISYLIFPLTILSSPSSLTLAYPLLNIVSLFNPQTTPIPSFFLHIPYTTVSEIRITLVTYAWTVFFLYPAYFVLIGFGWAMQSFEPDAVDLYLSLGL